jgi:antitoxin StbD
MLLIVSLILSQLTASVIELKKQPMETVRRGGGQTIAILNRNEPVFYCVPRARYAAMMEALEGADLVRLVREREGEEEIAVDFDARRKNNIVYKLAKDRLDHDA